MHMHDLGSSIAEQGWLQGSILSDQDLAELKKSSSDVECQTVQVGVVASHSCDLTHHSPEGEPFAEIFVAEVADSQNGNFTHAKHPRRLQLLMYRHNPIRFFLQGQVWHTPVKWEDPNEIKKIS